MDGYFEYSLEATLYLHDVMMVMEISLMTTIALIIGNINSYIIAWK